MFIGGELGYRVLRHLPTPRGWRPCSSSASSPKPGKLETYWGRGIWDELADRTVIDFGCGSGGDSIDLAKRGARRVIGLDIDPEMLAIAARGAEHANVADRCSFQTTTSEKADAIISVDSFEHFADPAGTLRTMADLLTPGGTIYVSFGPPWFHPYGGHSFSAFPWAHLLFTEQALLRWRALYCGDGATRFHEVRFGLNQMTITRFRRLVRQSPLRMTDFRTIPIRPVRLLHNRLTQEFFTSIVRCKLWLASQKSVRANGVAPTGVESSAGLDARELTPVSHP